MAMSAELKLIKERMFLLEAENSTLGDKLAQQSRQSKVRKRNDLAKMREKEEREQKIRSENCGNERMVECARNSFRSSISRSNCHVKR